MKYLKPMLLILFIIQFTLIPFQQAIADPEPGPCEQIRDACYEDNPFIWWLSPYEHAVYNMGCDSSYSHCLTILEPGGGEGGEP